MSRYSHLLVIITAIIIVPAMEMKDKRGTMKYDVIIVGGGAAGSVLAGRLSEDPNRSVLVLEAGKDYPDFDNIPDEVKYGHTRYAESPESEHNWALRGVATEEQGEIHVAQGKVIGGGSSINGQAMQRGLPEDYDDWASLGNGEWSYANVLPFFRKMENDLDIQDDFHGTEGPMPVRRRLSSAEPAIQQAFREACVRDGFAAVEDTNGANPSGVGVAPTNNLGGVRVSTAIAYLSQVRHRLNLTVRGEVQVRRVLFQGARAVGVEAESGGEIFTVEADRVVLSAGALRSPHLLMLSGVGPKDHLEEMGVPVVQDLPGVGQSLWNHMSVHINYKVRDGVELPVDLDAPHYRLIFTAPDSETDNDMVLSTVNVVDEREERVAGVRTSYRTGEVPADRSARISCTLGVPRGSGYVRLGSADPSVQPSFNYRYLQHPEDLRRVREGIRFGARLLESEAYRGVVDHRITPTDETLADDDALNLWMRQTVGTARHVSGTCRMGPDSDSMTVVDQYCRVKGLQGIWVADASVVPQLLRGGGMHPTVIMIGERVVDWIAQG